MNNVHLSQLISKAIQHRSAIGWDDQANDGLKIKDNKLPLTKSKNPSDKYYVDNWILKSINWIHSMLTGADISVELQSIDGNYNQSMQLMECEVNFLLDIFKWLDQGEKALLDRYWTGIGVVKNGWSAKKIDNDFHTGIPNFQYIDARKVYLDPNPNNMKYIVHSEEINKEDILNYFPEYPELQRVDSRKFTLYIVQVKELKTKKQVAFYIEDKDDIVYFDLDEYLSELQKGLQIPEGIIVSDPIESEYDEVTEYLFLKEQNRILKQYSIGSDFSYTVLKGAQVTDSPYSFGLPYFLKDMQELSIMLMTILTLSTLKHHKQIRIVHPEAITNYKEIKDKLHLPGVDILIDKDWEYNNPDKKPIEYLDPPKFSQELEFLEQKITEVIKSTTGVTNTLQGAPEYSGVSGVAVAQFQNQAKVIHKKDYIQWSKFISENVKSIMSLIETYRNYPHKIMGIDDSGIRSLIDVAVNDDSSLKNSNYIITVLIDENQEAIKKMEEDLIIRLYQLGLVTPEDVLQKMPFKNIDKIIENYNNRQAMTSQSQPLPSSQGA